MLRSHWSEPRPGPVHSHLASTLTFVFASPSNFNIESVVMLTFMLRIGTESILCICIFLPLLLLLRKSRTQTSTLMVYSHWLGQERGPGQGPGPGLVLNRTFHIYTET